MKGILFFDIDGTLIDSDAHHTKPGDSTLQAMIQAEKNGYMNILCSGRNRTELAMFRNLPIDGWIFSDGAGIELFGQEEKLFPFEDAWVQQLLSDCESGDIEVKLSAADSSYLTPMVYDFYSSFSKEHQKHHPEMDLLKDMHMMESRNWNHEPILQIDIDFQSEETERLWLSRHEQECHYMKMGYMEYTGTYHGEIAPSGISKGSGCIAFANLCGVNIEDCYAFGDSMNDVDSLKTAGHGIAMGNADPQLFAYADYVTDTIQNDGIAKAMRHFGIIQ